MDENVHLKQRIGTTLSGQWMLERLLGVGGMAVVHLGVHKAGRSVTCACVARRSRMRRCRTSHGSVEPPRAAQGDVILASGIHWSLNLNER